MSQCSPKVRTSVSLLPSSVQSQHCTVWFEPKRARLPCPKSWPAYEGIQRSLYKVVMLAKLAKIFLLLSFFFLFFFVFSSLSSFFLKKNVMVNYLINPQLKKSEIIAPNSLINTLYNKFEMLAKLANIFFLKTFGLIISFFLCDNYT